MADNSRWEKNDIPRVHFDNEAKLVEDDVSSESRIVGAQDLDCTGTCCFVFAVAVSFADGFWPEVRGYRGKGENAGRIWRVDKVEAWVVAEYIKVAL